MIGKFQKRPFMNLPVPFERDHRPALRDSWRDFSAHFERTSIHWKRKVTHLRATYAVPVLEVKRHPGFARIRFLRYAGGRKDFAASGRHPYVIAVLNPEPSRVLRADFDRRVAGNRVDAVRLVGHGTGVVVPEDAPRRQHEGVVLVGKFGSGPVLSGTVGTEPALQVHAKAGNNPESAESSRRR